ncbi:hypothetical protein DY000_02045897 [Brassica cretica]|uniref:Uncharacterized protein n=1 Tax=Brassica cretica TaxID=69181 RepID=A0ABQ7F1A6_BRACR|nr:hypothetical protein DY000_02045897 [Brassica cretica]
MPLIRLYILDPRLDGEVLYKAVEGGGRGGQRRQKSTQRRDGSDTHPLRSDRYPRKPEVIRKEEKGRERESLTGRRLDTRENGVVTDG